jgi:hypothetical protein
MRAQERLTARAPRPVNDRASGSGGVKCHDLVPGSPEGGQTGDEEDASERHPDLGPAAGGPSERYQDQEVDRGVLEEIDAVGKKRHRADGERDCKLDTEIGEIEKSDETNHSPQVLFMGWHIHLVGSSQRFSS